MKRRLIIVAISMLFLDACRALLFSDHVGCEDCSPGVPIEGTGERITRPADEYPWEPLIDACVEQGTPRDECIESLPADVLEQFETWESERARIRREQTNTIR